MFTTEKLLGQARMGIRSDPVFPPHFPRLGPRYPHSPGPATHRKEGSHYYHPFRASRPDHDEILQVLGGQFVGVLLCWHSGTPNVSGLHQELHGWECNQCRIEQFSQCGTFLRWLV